MFPKYNSKVRRQRGFCKVSPTFGFADHLDRVQCARIIARANSHRPVPQFRPTCGGCLLQTDFWKFFAVNMASGGAAGAGSLTFVCVTVPLLLSGRVVTRPLNFPVRLGLARLPSGPTLRQ